MLKLSRRQLFLSFKDTPTLELTYKNVVRSNVGKAALLDWYVRTMNPGSLDALRRQAKSEKHLGLVLPPTFGDPHRVLFQYSLKRAEPVATGLDGCPVYACDPGYGETQEIKIVDMDVIETLAQETLKLLGRDPTPQSAYDFLEEMIEGGLELAEKQLGRAIEPYDQWPGTKNEATWLH
eukprot:NODE_5726_length_680_cov_41.121157_g5703_i0.p1 GENE.NODE_5726_length_680_cov_41.121157_g5703_i0~~NODE_5726_length_680_cov_41.121157_g5703_i0.p1  ORF type:complete len:179 (-),score=30.44 NODE_5726_length_680_cov_41.121157_g5703_i0:87-623(-)